jgi:hypothetical protein
VREQLDGPLPELGRPNNRGVVSGGPAVSDGPEGRVDLGPGGGRGEPLEDERVGADGGERAVEVVGGGGELVGEDACECVLRQGETVRVG